MHESIIDDFIENLIKRNIEFEEHFVFMSISIINAASFAITLIAWFKDTKCLPDFNSTLHRYEMIREKSEWKMHATYIAYNIYMNLYINVRKKPNTKIATETMEEDEEVETISQLKKCSFLIIYEMQADICCSVQITPS